MMIDDAVAQDDEISTLYILIKRYKLVFETISFSLRWDWIFLSITVQIDHTSTCICTHSGHFTIMAYTYKDDMKSIQMLT